MAFLNLNGYNVGTDISVTISNDLGDVFPANNIGHMMRFESTFIFEELKIVPISNGGRPLFESIPNGITGSMEFTRYNGAQVGIWAALQSAFYDSGVLPHWTILAAVTNRDLTVDDYVWNGVVFSRPQFGNFDGIRDVTQSLEWSASYLSTPANFAALVPALGSMIGTYNPNGY